MSLRSDILAANRDTATRDRIVKEAVRTKQTPSWVWSKWTSKTIVDASGKLELFFMRDALAIGTDSEPLYVPTTIGTAQEIADMLGAIILSPKLIDDVFADTRTQKVPFQGIPGLFKEPGKDEAYMQSSEAMLYHSDSINKVVDKSRSLVMGHSKCLALGPALSRLGIYGGYGGSVHGWGIQSYPGPHDASWVDYSQQLNLVSRMCVHNGVETNLASIFATPSLSHLTSYNGAFTPHWPTGVGSGGGGATPPKGGPLVPPTGKPASLARSFDGDVPGAAEGYFSVLTFGAPWPREIAGVYARWLANRITGNKNA